MHMLFKRDYTITFKCSVNSVDFINEDSLGFLKKISVVSDSEDAAIRLAKEKILRDNKSIIVKEVFKVEAFFIKEVGVNYLNPVNFINVTITVPVEVTDE